MRITQRFASRRDAGPAWPSLSAPEARNIYSLDSSITFELRQERHLAHFAPDGAQQEELLIIYKHSAPPALRNTNLPAVSVIKTPGLDERAQESDRQNRARYNRYSFPLHAHIPRNYAASL